MKSFADKVAAITGAGSGIGRGLAIAIAQRGCHVALSDINTVGLAETARAIADSDANVKITTHTLDVADRAAVFAWADTVARDHGRCNLIFNNAGVSLAATAAKMRHEDFVWLMNINFWGVVHGTQAFLPHLTASGEGHIVNISSLFGIITVPGQSAYCASKFAVRGFTETLRQELELTNPAVGATCVHPGGIKTNIARAARVDASVVDLGVDDVDAFRVRFEKLFRVSPAGAAAVILKGVKNNERRVLIGADAHAIDAVVRMIPAAYQKLSVALAKRLLH